MAWSMPGRRSVPARPRGRGMAPVRRRRRAVATGLGKGVPGAARRCSRSTASTSPMSRATGRRRAWCSRRRAASGGCGSYLVVDLATRRARLRAHRRLRHTPRSRSPIPPGLVRSEAVYRPGDAHCCPSADPHHDPGLRGRRRGPRPTSTTIAGLTGCVGSPPASIRPMARIFVEGWAPELRRPARPRRGARPGRGYGRRHVETSAWAPVDGVDDGVETGSPSSTACAGSTRG